MKKTLLRSLLLLTLACGSGTIQFEDIVSIPAGDKEGTALSGTFSVFYEVKNDGCAQVSALQIPAAGNKTPLDVEMTQAEGALTLASIDETTLRGGIDFDSHFELGGASIASRDGLENILRMIRFTGSFQDKDNFTGQGEERLTGKISTENVDCTFVFGVTGVRKTS